VPSLPVNRDFRQHSKAFFGGARLWVAHTLGYGRYGSMKTTLDIHDALLLRAKRLSKRTGKTLRALVEEGLQHVLAQQGKEAPRYILPDRAVGDPTRANPLETWSWQDLRDEIYGEPSKQ